MSKVAAYQHKFRLEDPDSVQTSSSSSRVSKRNRVPISCLPCRNRKLRCDRDHPACSNCTKRGATSFCSYSSPSNTSKVGSSESSTDSVKSRVDDLEKLLLSMVSKSSTSSDTSGSAACEVKGVPDGFLAATGNDATYVGGTHWAAILENIRELKFSLDGPEAGLAPYSAPRGTSIFHTGAKRDLQSIIDTYMPPRTTANRLLAVYLNSRYAILPSIHCPRFQRMYDQFWEDFRSLPPMWVAQLFAVLFLSNALSIQKNVIPGQSANMVETGELYLKGCVESLEYADYTRPQSYAVEALLIYSQCMFWTSSDPGGELWILFGMLVRLAIRMGYHTEPSQLPNLSPFQGEMRRRTWLTLRQFDLLGAWQHGLPCMIRPSWSTTRQPRNLRDEDFDEDTLIPPSRPNSFLTVVSWEIAKDDLYKVAAEILDEQLSQTQTPEEKVQRLDQALHDAHDAISSVLKCKPMSKSLADPADLIMMRVKIETLYQKSLCVLHRNNLKASTAAAWSRTVCAESAMALLGNLNDIFEECSPGGQMSSERWMVGTIHLSDFFLGASVLCWILSSEEQEQTAGVLSQESMVKMNYLLLQSYQYCVQQQSRSREAHQVAAALRVILSRLRLLPSTVEKAPSSTPGLSESSTDTSNTLSNESIPETQVNATQFNLPDLPIDSLFASNEDIDWNTFDQYFSTPVDPMTLDPTSLNFDDLSLPQMQTIL